MDLSAILLRWKRRAWVSGDLTIVAPSHWLADKARGSSLFEKRNVRVIHTGVDTKVFRPIDKAVARGILRLPLETPLVLYGATNALTDPRKGGDAVVDAFRVLLESERIKLMQPALVVFGTSQRPTSLPMGTALYRMGVIRDEQLLSLVYSACDVFVAPSKEENLANAVLEAMACGLPCVAFDVGGMPEAIQHLETGFLVPPGDVANLAVGIRLLLEDPVLRGACAVRARQRAEQHFSLAAQAREYLQVIRGLVNS